MVDLIIIKYHNNYIIHTLLQHTKFREHEQSPIKYIYTYQPKSKYLIFFILHLHSLI